MIRQNEKKVIVQNVFGDNKDNIKNANDIYVGDSNESSDTSTNTEDSSN